MSRAEITRINVPSDRSVKVMCSLLPSSVFPSAWKRGSSELCLVSGTTLRGALKKTCSASAWLTSCLSLLLRALPASQSNPITRVQSTIDVYYHHIRSLGSMAQRAVGDGRHNPQALAPGARLSEPLGGDLAQCLSSPGGINAKGKQLPRHLLSRPGALDWDLWIKTERDQIFPTVESIAVAPVSAARGRNEKMEAAAKGHLARIANEDAPGMSAVDGRVGAGN